MRIIDADKIGLTGFEIIMCNGDYKEALKMILDKIEKTPTVDVLDKIRAEINKALSAETISDNNQQISDVGIGLESALSIIDKYKAESEDEE